jgi:hypothetical protein
VISRSNSGEHEKLRSSEGSCRQDDLPCGRIFISASRTKVDNTNAGGNTIGDEDLGDAVESEDLEVGGVLFFDLSVETSLTDSTWSGGVLAGDLKAGEQSVDSVSVLSVISITESGDGINIGLSAREEGVCVRENFEFLIF